MTRSTSIKLLSVIHGGSELTAAELDEYLALTGDDL